MSINWQASTSVSQGGTTPGGPVAAVPWGDSYVLFLSDPNGGIYGIQATPGFGWENVPNLTTTPGAPITALARGSQFMLFVANAQGEVFTNTGAPYQGWSGWVSVSQGSPGSSGTSLDLLPRELTVAARQSRWRFSVFGVFRAHPLANI
jgi:hypothetical protein